MLQVLSAGRTNFLCDASPQTPVSPHVQSLVGLSFSCDGASHFVGADRAPANTIDRCNSAGGKTRHAARRPHGRMIRCATGRAVAQSGQLAEIRGRRPPTPTRERVCRRVTTSCSKIATFVAPKNVAANRKHRSCDSAAAQARTTVVGPRIRPPFSPLSPPLPKTIGRNALRS